ncbi:MAG: hypothetical protein M1823_001302 [Watsoniomyces obsoletus]|nr:MAG: hypothetical protein M1823_001302 [Watsoniomyces obsoletus]
MSDPLPPTLTGGCLCGAIRYELKVTSPKDWPIENGTCQCTQCRKFTGSLIPHLLSAQKAWITWSPPINVSSSSSSSSSETETTTYREYNSSPGCYRGFCNQCGSSLTWRSDGEPENIEIFVGSLDQQSLMGEEVTISSGSEERKRIPGYGDTLQARIKHIWFRNAIKGITDDLKGPRFEEGSEECPEIN